MNQEIKTKWLEALRSGEYKQATGGLRFTYGFCCLGVLCDIVDPNKWNPISSGHYTHDYGEISVLPTSVRELAGLDSHNPDTSQGSLAKLNDNGKSFKEIADIIEKEL